MTSALQTVTRLDALVAFDTPGVASGVELFALPEGAMVLDLWAFCESTTNADAGEMAALAGDYGFAGAGLGGLSPVPYAIEHQDTALLVAADEPVIFTQSGGTWTAGSIRVVAVILEAA